MTTDATLAGALANHDLGEFEGRQVLGVGIEIPGAAGGLRDAMKIEPVTAHQDEEMMILIRGPVGKIRFDPVKDTQGVTRVHVLNVSDAMVVEGEDFDAMLDAQKERIQRAKEAAAGVARLPTDEELEFQHNEGAHSEGLVDGCPSCDAEQDAAEQEAAEADAEGTT